jgi:DNA-directed RNA polymerase subunit RPC12/RpoP
VSPLPVYVCPKCGRRVELPEGNYYCKVCGPSVIMEKSPFTEKDIKVGEIVKSIGKEFDWFIGRTEVDFEKLKKEDPETYEDFMELINKMKTLIYTRTLAVREKT